MHLHKLENRLLYFQDLIDLICLQKQKTFFQAILKHRKIYTCVDIQLHDFVDTQNDGDWEEIDTK